MKVKTLKLTLMLEDIPKDADYSDIGNSIGQALGNLSAEETEDLIEGIKHGLSLQNGTH